MPNPNIEEETTKRRKGPILGSGEIGSAYAADIGEVFHVGVEWLLYGDEEKKCFPLNEQMTQWLWNHPEIREQIWKMMEDC